MSKVIACMNETNTAVRGHGIWCPACRTIHTFPSDRWAFNGDMEKPTFSPSMLIKWNDPASVGYDLTHKTSICHSFVRDGKIQYCGDCTHPFKGLTVDLPDVHEKIGEGEKP